MALVLSNSFWDNYCRLLPPNEGSQYTRTRGPASSRLVEILSRFAKRNHKFPLFTSLTLRLPATVNVFYLGNSVVFNPRNSRSAGSRNFSTTSTPPPPPRASSTPQRPPVVLLACTPPSRMLRQTAVNDAASMHGIAIVALLSDCMGLLRAGWGQATAFSCLLSAYTNPQATQSPSLLLSLQQRWRRRDLSLSAEGCFSSRAGRRAAA